MKVNSWDTVGDVVTKIKDHLGDQATYIGLKFGYQMLGHDEMLSWYDIQDGSVLDVCLAGIFVMDS